MYSLFNHTLNLVKKSINNKSIPRTSQIAKKYFYCSFKNIVETTSAASMKERIFF